MASALSLSTLAIVMYEASAHAPALLLPEHQQGCCVCSLQRIELRQYYGSMRLTRRIRSAWKCEMGSRSSSSSSSSTRRLQAVELVSIHEISLRLYAIWGERGEYAPVSGDWAPGKGLAGLGGSDVGDDERFRSSIIAPPPPPGAASGVNESLCLDFRSHNFQGVPAHTQFLS